MTRILHIDRDVPVDMAMTQAQFEALPEAERKAWVQRLLEIWGEPERSDESKYAPLEERWDGP